ncbi:PDZ and LIM domain protein 5 isoform X2 [Lingula anatina]|uniref:PDZ and LIM domain protein 5 isoform X2 n=1 Tax=Lingula anatina TaxID=7574 RepID=A0A1S3I2I5_LINAN|nr:PDZ and LIM domain protein 5 isoform X2 [Lingula anatina]|eukprot:XP_013392482.1 PDZ and LIM domain protein 5 isoform X2 [Lingula anatina]
MSGVQIKANLARVDHSTPWGFRMQGGKDFSAPLSIQRVTPGSLAAKCGLQQGDILLRVGGLHAENMKHKEAQDIIIKSGDHLELTLLRGGPAMRKPDSSQFGTTYNHPGKLYGDSVDSVTTQMQKTTVTAHRPADHSVRYDEHKPGQEMHYPGYIDPNAQSHSFTVLKDTIDRGQDPATVRDAPWARYAVVGKENEVKKYAPSDTLKLVHAEEMDKMKSDPPSGPGVQSKTYQLLDGKVKDAPQQGGVRRPGAGVPPPPAPAPAAPRAPPAPVKAPAGPRPFPGAGPVGPIQRGKRGDYVFKQSVGTGMKIPVCAECGSPIRGPFVIALGKNWCPDHFVCSNPDCRTKLMDTGFIEVNGKLYCENDYAKYFAPSCNKCNKPVVGDCINALNQQFHPECFLCAHCKGSIGGSVFHIENGMVYCERDWQALFQTKCISCEFPIEPGDRWVEALGSNWHAECFNCATCQVNLEGQGFVAKNNRPYCKRHGQGF